MLRRQVLFVFVLWLFWGAVCHQQKQKAISSTEYRGLNRYELFPEETGIKARSLGARINEVTQFWTPERIKEAVSLDLVTMEGEPKHSEDQGRERIHRSATTDFVADAQYSTDPYQKVGRLFFTFEGSMFACSASSVGGSYIITAAHCLVRSNSNPPVRGSNYLFVPGRQLLIPQNA